MKRFNLLLGALLCCSVWMISDAGADENRENFRRGERSSRMSRQSKGNRSGGNSAFLGRIAAEEKIAAAFPEKYAALEAAREKYELELAALAKEANVELPAQRDDTLRQIRKKFPAEFSSVMQEISTSPREAMRKLRQLAEKAGVKLFPASGNRGSWSGFSRETDNGNQFARKFDRPDMAKLRRKYPEQMREYDAMRSSDPDGARRKLMEIIAQERDGKK